MDQLILRIRRMEILEEEESHKITELHGNSFAGYPVVRYKRSAKVAERL